jgi:uncharacterized membrane protein (DUF106 family)
MNPTAVNWSLYDKIAAILVLGLMSGYYLAPIEQLVTTTLQTVFGPLVTLLPFSALLLVLSGATGVASSVMRHRLQDTERLQQLKDRIEEVNDRLQEADTDDDDASTDLQSDQQAMMHDWMAMLKLQFRPAVWSMLVTIPIFLWVRWFVTAPTAAIAPVALSLPLIGPLAWTATVIGPIKIWLVWYFGGSMSSAVVSRKILTHVIE